MLSKRIMDVLEVENEKSATHPIDFEETLTFPVFRSCCLSKIGLLTTTGKPGGTAVGFRLQYVFKRRSIA